VLPESANAKGAAPCYKQTIAIMQADRSGRKNRGRRVPSERGSALVETAVTLPLLLMVMLGLARMGIAFHQYLVLTDAVRVGARQLAVSRGQSTDPCASAVSRLVTAAPTLPGSLGITVTVNGINQGTSCSGLALVGGWEGQVVATYPCNLQIFGIDYAPGCMLQAQQTVVIE
jgi:hypothetical protein